MKVTDCKKLQFYSGIILALLATLLYPQLLPRESTQTVFTNTVFSLVILGAYVAAICWALPKWSSAKASCKWIAGIVSGGFSLAMVWGSHLAAESHIPVKVLGAWTAIFVYTIFLTPILAAVYELLSGKKKQISQNEVSLARTDYKLLLLLAGLLILCWIPVFLAEYPGFFTYDAQDEYVQVATRLFNTHHPLSHVALLGGLICGIHKLTGSYDLGIAAYMVVQMLVVSVCFAYQLIVVLKRTGSKVLTVLGFIWFGFFPTIVMFVLCSAKDTLFTCFLMLAVIRLAGENKSSKKWLPDPVLVVSLAGMMLFRHNAAYALLVYLVILLGIVLLVFYLDKKNRLPAWSNLSLEQKGSSILVAGALSIVIYLGCNALLVAGLHAGQVTEHQEMLTVPIQQLARTWNEDETYFTAKQQEVLYQILPPSVLVHYTPELSDMVKYAFDNEAYEANTAAFWKMWLSVGLKHPVSYINAWLCTCYGYWYPDAVVNVYAGHQMFTYTYEDSSYFGYEVELPGQRKSLIPWLDEVYRKLSLELWVQKVPAVSMLFSMGALFWFYVGAAGLLLARKEFDFIWGFGLPALIFMTLLLGPTFLPRYTIFMWYLLPLFITKLMVKD